MPKLTVNDDRLHHSVKPVLNIERFDQLLQTYDRQKRNALIDRLSNGVETGYCGPYENVHIPNLVSASKRPEIMRSLLNKEVEKGRILGPYPHPPFSTQRINAMGFVPKKEPNQYRMIVDLSQPEGNSVNFHIDRAESQVFYPSVQSAIDLILALHEQGKQPTLAKVDIKSAFRLLPLAPSQFPLMGLSLDNQYYVDAFLPMGGASSCRIFQEFSDAVAHIAKVQGNIDDLVNYLDDFLLVSPGSRKSAIDLQSFQNLAADIGLPLAPEKMDGPAHVLTFLGIELDCLNLEARLPPDKIAKAQKLIKSLLEREKTHVKQIESLHGYLNYCAAIIPAGRAFLRSLSRLLRSRSKWITIPMQVRMDLQIWLDFLIQFNGRSMFVHSRWDGPSVLHLETDSSGSWGCGAVFGDSYFALPWPQEVPRSNLSLLEFYPIVIATFIWQDSMRNKRIKIWCDNQATVAIINDLKSQNLTIMKLVRIFALHCLNNNIWFQAQFLPGKINVGPDALSRGRMHLFRQLFPGKVASTRVIPDHLLPQNLLAQ